MATKTNKVDLQHDWATITPGPRKPRTPNLVLTPEEQDFWDRLVIAIVAHHGKPNFAMADRAVRARRSREGTETSLLRLLSSDPRIMQLEQMSSTTRRDLVRALMDDYTSFGESQKIQRIKAIRNRFLLTLKEAKEAVEATTEVMSVFGPGL